MPTITILGAGSTVFARQLMTDILHIEGLDEGSFALVDIDPSRLELAHQIAVVIQRTGLAQAGESFPVGLIGSAFRAGSVFVEPLAARVRERAPHANVAVVDMPPVVGSLLLAARACAHPLRRDELADMLVQAERQAA